MPVIDTLIAIAESADSFAKARQIAQARQPEFPHNGCANFLSALLDQAGMSVGVHFVVQDLASALEARGWQHVAPAAYQPGDIGVTKDDIHTGRPAHIYLVLARETSDRMLIADNQAPAPHTRSVSGSDGKTPTDYFLRDIAAAQPLSVQVNGTTVADAAGFLDANSHAWAWVRPIAQALGAEIVGIPGETIHLKRGTSEADLAAQVTNGKAFVALRQLDSLSGVTVKYAQESNTIQISAA